MPSTGLLTADDLDEIGQLAFDIDQPRELAAELVGAVDQGLVADQVDTGYALLLAAEITERDGDLPEALRLAERAIEAHRVHAEPDGYPRVFRARLLLRLRRDDEAMAELTALRPLMSEDPDVLAAICDALEAAGRAGIAEQWLTAALSAALQRRELASPHRGPDYLQAAAMAFVLAQCRHRIRGDLELPHDSYDYLADRLMSAVHGLLGGDQPDDEAAALLFWPQPEFDRLGQRWPALAGEYGRTWDEYRSTVQKTLVQWSESSTTRLGLVPGSVEELTTHAERNGDDPTDPQVRQGYAQNLTDHVQEIAWPPAAMTPAGVAPPRSTRSAASPARVPDRT